MKIVQLVENLGIGGLPNYVLQLSWLLKNAGHEVLVAYTKGTPGAHLETAGLDVIHAPEYADLSAVSPDIIHIHLLSDIDYLEELSAQNNSIVIRSFHDYTSTCLRRGKRRFPGDRCQRALDYGCVAFGCLIGPPLPDANTRLPRIMNLPEKIREKDIYRGFDAAICGSHHMKGMLLNNGFAESKVFRIPYFSKFEAEAYNDIVKRDGVGTTRPFELLFSGQAVSGKGLEVLIEALGGVKEDWHLTVFCEGPRLEHAQALAKKLEIFDKITFNGWAPQSVLIDAYKNADIFILPSIWDDPGPLVGIEALACGTPVVGFAVGGVPDYVIDGKTGFLVKDITAKGLERGIKRAIKDPEDLKALAEPCKTHVIQHHAEKKHLDDIMHVYNVAQENLLSHNSLSA
ncbi:MAG: glycosyltransferase family 4 protein [Alphaproteobacteria bacterium]